VPSDVNALVGIALKGAGRPLPKGPDESFAQSGRNTAPGMWIHNHSLWSSQTGSSGSQVTFTFQSEIFVIARLVASFGQSGNPHCIGQECIHCPSAGICRTAKPLFLPQANGRPPDRYEEMTPKRSMRQV
jgi:hypothetical protein